MLSVAYITNEFPVAVEPYVWEEILELRRNGITVVPCSARRPQNIPEDLREIASQTLYLFPVIFSTLLRTAWLGLWHGRTLIGLLCLVLTHRCESLARRIRAVAHTFLGVYYAAALKNRRVEHIHVHHGYFAAWIAMTAARLLGITYSMTLHGSDLLLHHAFLDFKLQNCKFCLTVSEFNRQHVLANYPDVSAEKIRVQRMGVDVLTDHAEPGGVGKLDFRLVMLSVGRLHGVKDHAFLLRACSQLKLRGINFICLIAGEGPERPNLEKLIRDLGLQHQVTLLGHVPRTKLETYYAMCDMVVLTSRSEGVPLALMEAMAQGRTVLAPAITGVPELVVDGVTGFLYRLGSIDDFVAKIEAIRDARPTLGAIRHRARQHVFEHFNRATNLAEFAELFPTLIVGTSNENSLLQQI
jgi:glycosyltransferase involved in cell wall biosynthesis